MFLQAKLTPFMTVLVTQTSTYPMQASLHMKRYRIITPQETLHRRFGKSLVWMLCAVAILAIALVVIAPGLRRSGAVATPSKPDRFSYDESSKPGSRKVISLASYYNAGHQTNWLGGGRFRGRDLAPLPAGVNSYGGVPFQVHGVVQLRGMSDRANANIYPESVDGIRIGMKCRKLHFLHATAWSTAAGTRIAGYDLHYADGTHAEVAVVYGDDLRDYQFEPKDPAQTQGAAWSSREGRYPSRVFKSTWVNPKPEVEVKDFDFFSTGSTCYPFLLALTAEY